MYIFISVLYRVGGCPHAAIREDITMNLLACEELTRRHSCDLILLESGGDNLAADFSRELADYTIYVIDTAGGDKVPRKGGPGKFDINHFLCISIKMISIYYLPNMYYLFTT